MSFKLYSTFLKAPSGFRYQLSDGSIYLAHDRLTNEIVIKNKTCGHWHARIITMGDNYHLEMYQGQQINVNGRTIYAIGEGSMCRLTLKIGDTIEICDQKFELMKYKSTTSHSKSTDVE